MNAVHGSHVEALRNLLGERGLLTGSDMASYESGARHKDGRAAFVMRPRTTEEVSAAVAYCVRHAIPFVPQAGNTGVVGASTPDASGDQAILSVERLTETWDFDFDNRSVTCGAGLRLSEVNARLEPHGMFFPIDLGSDPRIGGMLSTNTGGSRFLKYGDVRRNTLGAKVVLADGEGTVLDLSSHLRKNNVGVDWKHLFIGSAGAFGVITECVLNVECLPRQTAVAILVPANSTRVLSLLRYLEEDVGPLLSAFEGMSREAIEATIDYQPAIRNPFARGAVPDFAILCEISRHWEPRESELPIADVLQQAVSRAWEADLLEDAMFGPPEEIWRMRHIMSEAVRSSGNLVAFDLAFRRGDLPAFLARMRKDLAKDLPAVRVCDFGHLGDGGVHFNLVVPSVGGEGLDPEFERILRDRVYRIAVEEFGGSFSAEHAIGRKNQRYYDMFTSAPILDLAKAVKDAIAPGNIGAARYHRPPQDL